jgi:hypothetical protein
VEPETGSGKDLMTSQLRPGDIAHDHYHDWIVGEEHSLDPRMVWATHVESGYRTLLLRSDLTPGPALAVGCQPGCDDANCPHIPEDAGTVD